VHKSREEGKWITYGNRSVTKTKVLSDSIHGLKSLNIRIQADGWEYSALLVMK
jgi:hypothetical protein